MPSTLFSVVQRRVSFPTSWSPGSHAYSTTELYVNSVPLPSCFPLGIAGGGGQEIAGGEKEKSSGGDPWDAPLHDVKRGKPKGRLHTGCIAPVAGAGLKWEHWPPSWHAVAFRCLPACCPAYTGAAAACRDTKAPGLLIYVSLSRAEGTSDAVG